MAVIGELATLITARTEPFTRGLAHAGRAAKTFSATVTGSIGGAMRDLTGFIASTSSKLTMLTGGLGVTGLAMYAMKQAVAFENAEVAFTTFLKSGEKAKTLLKELTKFSDITPFNDTEVMAAGRSLLAFGFAAEEIVPTLNYLGDAAAGSQSSIEDLVNILGKVRTKGRAQMEELNRFIERGINIIPALAVVMHKSEKSIAGLVTKGKVGFTEVVAAMKLLNAEGGLFQNAMENLSKTTSGKLSTLKSAFDGLMRDVGKSMLEGINVKQLTTELTNLAVVYKSDIVDATVAGVRLLMAAIPKAITGGKSALGAMDEFLMLSQRAQNRALMGWEWLKSAGPRFANWSVQNLGSTAPGQRTDFQGMVNASNARLEQLAQKNANLAAYATTPDQTRQEQREALKLRLEERQVKAQERMVNLLMSPGFSIVPGL